MSFQNSQQTTFRIFRYEHLDQFCVTRTCLISALLVSLEDNNIKDKGVVVPTGERWTAGSAIDPKWDLSCRKCHAECVDGDIPAGTKSYFLPKKPQFRQASPINASTVATRILINGTI